MQHAQNYPMHMMHRLASGDFHSGSNLIEGDVNLEGDIDFADMSHGDVDLTTGEAADMLIGAPAAGMITSKIRQSRSIPSSSPRAANANTTVATAIATGTMVDLLTIPAVIPMNANILQASTTTKIPGALIRQNIQRHRTLSVYQSLFKTVVPSGTTVDIVLDKALFTQAGGTAAVYTVPLIFLTISSSTLNTRAGNRYSLQFLAGKGEYGPTLNDTILQFERINATQKLTLTLIPFVRVKDTIKPVLAVISDSTWLASDNSITLRLTGVSTDETIQVVVPGIDSIELDNFMRTFKIKG